MNVTTKKSECDPRLEQRQLEVALEHAHTAGLAAAAKTLSECEAISEEASAFVEVRYPSYQFREALRSLRLDVRADGKWIVLALRKHWSKEAQGNAAKAASIVLRHYYPDEDFVPCCPMSEKVVA